jgi:hypothetical protein
MGPVGIALAVLGGLGIVLGQRALARAYAGLDADQSARADVKLGRLQRAVWLIAAAVVIYYEARSFGFGRGARSAFVGCALYLLRP